MNNGKQWFQSDTQGLHVLFESIALDENNGLIKAYLLIITICASERALTYCLDYKFSNKTSTTTTTGSRILHVFTRTILYGLVTAFRLLYMLVIMYFNTGLFILVVTSLTVSQLFVEIAKSSQSNKTGPLAKVQNKKGYSDLPTTDRTLSAVEMNDEEEEEEHEYTNNMNEARMRQYDIPKIVISNEKSSYSTENVEAKRSD